MLTLEAKNCVYHMLEQLWTSYRALLVNVTNENDGDPVVLRL